MGITIDPVFAFTFETKGSPTIKSKDGNFAMVFGARAHLDVHAFNDDKSNPAYPPFGSQVPNSHPEDGFNFRRGYTDVTARFYDLSFKFQNDFAAGTFPGSLREAWVAAKLGPGQLMIGQFKPFRSMEELTSSNEITMMERPSTTSSGIYSGRQWMMGMGYKGIFADQLGYAVDIMSVAHAGMPIAGASYGGRLFWVPFAEEGNTLHFGFSCSRDDPSSESLPAKVVDVYGGRRGISKSLGIAGAGGGPSGADSQTTWEVEAAYSIGPVTLQGEYANSRLDNTHLVAGGQKDSTIQAYYVQAGWFVTGERSIYRKERGAFGKPKPISKWGALELAVRYDLAENMSQSLAADPCGTGTSKCQVQIITLGANWYVRQGLRFMLNYYMTEAGIGHGGNSPTDRRDNLSVISFRTQLSF
ncbi:OprO/OprP family phosphate-selective porin [Nitrosospira sp. Nl5]|uniref:OprO/OprP family phosphate-selective porin n=1 Tax=Nitrosospira sp. Nl5 TaxID=200120 RepID=UPI000B85DDAF|nr:porin [Nitrosospira sp. Nl5]